MRLPSRAMLVGLAALMTSTVGTVTAEALVTGADTGDSTIRGVDFRDGSLTDVDIASSATNGAPERDDATVRDGLAGNANGAVVAANSDRLDDAPFAPVAVAAFQQQAPPTGPWNFQIGAVNTDAGPTILLEDQTYFSVEPRFDDPEPPPLTRIPLASLLGPLSITVNDAVAETDPDEFSVIIRGTSPDFLTATPAEPADVLVLVDWAGGSEDTPTVVVSGRLSTTTLAGALGEASGLPGIDVAHRTYTVGRSQFDDKNHLQHISRPDNLPAAAAAYFRETYGALPTPNVPALEVLDVNLFLSLGVDLAEFPSVAADAFGWQAGDRAVFEGGLGIGMGQAFDPTTATWSLGAVLPGSPADSTLMPDWLDFATDVRWRGALAYDAEAGQVTFTAGVNASTELLGGQQAITLQATLAAKTADPSQATVSVLADVSGDWPSPFGIDWIDVNRIKITGTFGRAVPAGGTDPVTTASFSVDGFATIAGKEVTVSVKGALSGSQPSGTVEVRMNDTVSAAELIDVVEGASPLPLPDVPGEVLNPQLDNVAIRVDFSTTAAGQRVVAVTFGGTLTVHLPLPGGGLDVGASMLVTIASDRNVTVGVRADSDIRLSDLLPGVDVPIDFTLASADGASSFGFLFSTTAVDKAILDLPVPMQRFYRPLHGYTEDDASPFQVQLPAGASVLGSFELPEQLTDVVDRLGWQSRVTARGTLPIFKSSTAVRLELEVALQSEELLPDFIHQVVGSIVLTGTAGAQPTIKLAFEGEVDLRIRGGLPEDVAEPVRDLGIPVGIDRPVQTSDECRPGQQALSAKRSDPDDPLHCYDLLRVTGTFGIEAKADGTVELSIQAGMRRLGGGEWYPFGLTWLGLDRLEIRGSIEAHPAGTVDFELGFAGDISALGGQKDVLAAIQVSLKLLVEPPWVLVELDGIRIASGSGFETGDLLDLQHLIAEAAGAGGSPFDLEALGLPNFALRNVDVSFSPKGVPELCMPQGLTLNGDLYINPSADAPTVNPSCENEQLHVAEADECLNRRADGCIASGRLTVRTTGIFGKFQIPGFDIGPIHLDKLNIDVAISVSDAHVIGSAAGRIDNPTDVGPDTLASGRVKIKFETTTFSVFGELDVLGFKALVDATAGYDLFQDPMPEFRLHVLLATDQYHISEPSFVSVATRELEEVLNPLRAIADVADDALGIGGSNPFSDLGRLTSAMQSIGMDVPAELSELNSEAAGFLSDFSSQIDYVGGSVFDLVMNGIPSFEVPEVCDPTGITDECFGGWGFGGEDGLCDVIFPASQFPNLRDSDGDCTIGGLVNAVILPAFEQAMGEIVDVAELDIRALIDALTSLDLSEPLLRLTCVEYIADFGPSAAFTELTVAGRAFGKGFGFRIGFDFTDPVGSLDELGQSVIEQLVNPSSVNCIGFNHDLFDATPDVGQPEAVLEIVAPEAVDEGQPFSLEGSFGVVLEADRVVEVDWGDGTVEQVTAATGTSGFTVEHTYADDDPSVTASDTVQIVASDLSSGAGTTTDPRQVAEHVTVRNVAPATVSFAAAGPIEEGRPQTFTVTFSDPGLADVHTVFIGWGDGQSTLRHHVPARERSVEVSHTYRDDNPAHTPVDPYDVTVYVLDDDGGRARVELTHLVHNVAPSGLALEVVSETVAEGAPVDFRLTWEDPGLDDTHAIYVDWADSGGIIREHVVTGEREVMMTRTWGDNGTFPVSVSVVDDDTGRQVLTVPVVVDNVDPDVAIDRTPTFDAPGGDTFLVRVGTPLEVGADLTDPGSDDETFTWTWGDGTVDTVTDRVNPPADDPLPSPSIQPRAITTGAVYEYALSCLNWLDLDVVDDDGGIDADRVPVVVVGDESDDRPRGWWYEEYLHFGLGRPSTKVDDRTKACHLLVTEHMSAVFGEVVPLATPQDAVQVLHPDRMTRITKFDRELLATWLNYASGAVGSDADGRIRPEFAEIVYDAEQVRLDPASTDRELHDAEKQLAEAQRRFAS